MCPTPCALLHALHACVWRCLQQERCSLLCPARLVCMHGELSRGILVTETPAPGLQEHPEIEWYLWIDSDTMIINPTFQMPLNKFKGKDLIIWGNETALLEGDGRNGTARTHSVTSSIAAGLLHSLCFTGK